MNKTIAALALLASSSTAFGMPQMPDPNSPPPPAPKKFCLKSIAERDRSLTATCDESEANVKNHARLLNNGCAAKQVAITLDDHEAIESCLPSGMMQL